MSHSLPSGLSIIENFISPAEEMDLITYIDGQEWSNTLSRRVQHYGYEYGYKPPYSMTQTKPIPSNLMLFDDTFNQVIVNEYMPEQGISAHTDNIKLFGNKIISVSLLSPVIMNFAYKNECFPVCLQPRSAVVLEDDARWKYTHEIPSRKSDMINGERIKRGRRVSITFRTYIHGVQKNI
jgi:alkylated DNA repair dioxygenase AlkB